MKRFSCYSQSQASIHCLCKTDVYDAVNQTFVNKHGGWKIVVPRCVRCGQDCGRRCCHMETQKRYCLVRPLFQKPEYEMWLKCVPAPLSENQGCSNYLPLVSFCNKLTKSSIAEALHFVTVFCPHIYININTTITSRTGHHMRCCASRQRLRGTNIVIVTPPVVGLALMQQLATVIGWNSQTFHGRNMLYWPNQYSF